MDMKFLEEKFNYFKRILKVGIFFKIVKFVV